MVSSNEAHVVCDTVIFRSIFHKECPWILDFEQMARAGVVFSLGDHAVAEIINQFETGVFSGADYVGIWKFWSGRFVVIFHLQKSWRKEIQPATYPASISDSSRRVRLRSR